MRVAGGHTRMSAAGSRSRAPPIIFRSSALAPCRPFIFQLPAMRGRAAMVIRLFARAASGYQSARGRARARGAARGPDRPCGGGLWPEVASVAVVRADPYDGAAFGRLCSSPWLSQPNTAGFNASRSTKSLFELGRKDHHGGRGGL